MSRKPPGLTPGDWRTLLLLGLGLFALAFSAPVVVACAGVPACRAVVLRVPQAGFDAPQPEPEKDLGQTLRQFRRGPAHP